MPKEKEIKEKCPIVVYPRYSISQDLRCKLSEKDREEIISLRKEGESYQKIANRFQVHPQSIWQIATKILEPEKYKEKMRKTVLWHKLNGSTNKESIKRFYRRKWRIMSKEMKNYGKFLYAKRNKTNTAFIR